MFRKIHPVLPIYKFIIGELHAVYTPGNLVLVTEDELFELQQAWNTGQKPATNKSMELVSQLEITARDTVEAMNQRRAKAYEPECLTVALGNKCNFACTYCYAKTGTGHTEINSKAVYGAARLVAQNCLKKGKKFTFVVHGGGEPTIQWGKLQELVSLTRGVAEQFGLQWYGYIATNGFMPEDRARWLAKNFSLVGLSCDGPLDIQDKQRPLNDGKESSGVIERTGRVLTEEGCRFLVRATITPQTVSRQSEIVSYLFDCLGANQIHFEPVYRAGRNDRTWFRPEDAQVFAEHFLAAQKHAGEIGCELTISGVRLDEVHGPYCNVLRDTISLTPSGEAVVCFLNCTEAKLNKAEHVVGRWDEARQSFELDQIKINKYLNRALIIPERCGNCINIYHCARECPETCYVDFQSYSNDSTETCAGTPPGFRCLVQRYLSEAWIRQAAEELIKVKIQQSISPLHSQKESKLDIVVNDMLRDAALFVDADMVLRQWQAVKDKFPDQRNQPRPVWSKSGFGENAEQAWHTICGLLDREKKRKNPISVYVHVPFCDRRCGFCDCYSFSPGKNKLSMQEDYFTALEREINSWSNLKKLSQRPVTTVHLGGGTPTYLDQAVLERIVESCRTKLAVTANTEWALESTTTPLTGDYLENLMRWGFNRLHVGVQTLEEVVRESIGRRDGTDKVLEKLSRALEMGFVVSVDLIYGLPGQTVKGLLSTLERLIALGIHGFSLYQLQFSKRNRDFLKSGGSRARDLLCDYIFLQVLEQMLNQSGYHKNHYTHYARSKDKNLYYTYPQRDEDLLALGPSADGLFDSYHYRHPNYREYVNKTDENMPALEGGVWEPALDSIIRPASIALSSGCISTEILQELKADALIEVWLESLYLQKADLPGSYRLTANGSWFIDKMLDQLEREIRNHM